MSEQLIMSGYPMILGGSQIKELTSKKKTSMAEQVVNLLQPHIKAGHMIQQSVAGLIKYMDSGLAAIALSYDDTILGFAKLYPHEFENNNDPPQGYEFSSWIVRPTVTGHGIGGKILMKSLEAYHEQHNPHADLFAVCAAENTVPVQILFATGGVSIARPPYVPNMLEAQTGSFQKEIIINLKTILKK